jgi:hypothetical protein
LLYLRYNLVLPPLYLSLQSSNNKTRQPFSSNLI